MGFFNCRTGIIIHCIIIDEASMFIWLKEFLLYKCWLNKWALICKEENEEMGRKNGSVFHLLWRLLWGSRGAMGAQPCDVTACRAQPLTNGLWQGQLTKARASAWILRTLSFSFLLSGRLLSDSCLMQSRLIYDVVPVGSWGRCAQESALPHLAPFPMSHWNILATLTKPSGLLTSFGADGPSPTSEESLRKAACVASTNRPCLISPWYLKGNSL